MVNNNKAEVCAQYQLAGSVDELCQADSRYRPAAAGVGAWLDEMSMDALNHLNEQAKSIFYRKGVTFTVYSDAQNIERMIPFDIIPRIIDFEEWQHIEAGCRQRITALNAFLHDIYHDQRIIKAGIVPPDYIYASGCYEPWMVGIELERPIYAHISGIDLIRDERGQFCVLEDNLRTPSGVSYMLESRHISEALLSEVFYHSPVLEVSDYPQRLKACLASATSKFDPQIVILTPGRFNSAYYEHAFLAHEMGVPLVHGYDLVVEDAKVYLQSIRGKVQVDVIYRRLDDDFIDPLGFREDSALGVTGLMSAYRAGNVVVVNAPGTGVADDKSLYPFVPDMIEFYLGESAILPNIKTYQCRNPDELSYVLDHLDKLVVKETQGSGGYGMLIGPQASSDEIAAYRQRLLANPSGFIAQPTISLSTCPTAVDNGIAPRHVDLRPFILSHGDGTVDIVPGGLTRVAMVEGSLVVNSSQGGGIKDTWVVAPTLDRKDSTDSLSPARAPYSDYLNHYSRTQGLQGNPIDRSDIILLLSTANYLIWLGRYSERLCHYDSLMRQLINHELDQHRMVHLIWHLGFDVDLKLPSPAMQQQLIYELEQKKIPSTIAAIESNVQDAKGVIGNDTAELYNLIKRLAHAGEYRAATLQLNACNAAMSEEHELVTCFWQLGRHFEQLERMVLLNDTAITISQEFLYWIDKLPKNTRWQELTRLANQLIQSQERYDFNKINRAFSDILQEGV